MKMLQLITASGTNAAEIGKDYSESCDGVRWEEPCDSCFPHGLGSVCLTCDDENTVELVQRKIAQDDRIVRYWSMGYDYRE